MPEITIAGRRIGPNHPPLVIAEIGINHEGDFEKAVRMVDDAAEAGCECVKFQTHIVDDEMIPNDVVPGHTKESIWEIMERCALSPEEDRDLMRYVESKGMVFLSTPFSRKAAVQLESYGVQAYKIGSGECNNYPLVEHIAGYGKPVIMSTGMNDIADIAKSVGILRKNNIPYALLHCTSLYPTPYNRVRLNALRELGEAFPDAVLGLSDHSMSNYPCFGATALGASILERHFTSDKSWPGPDISLSMDPHELRELIEGSAIVHESLAGHKGILPEEQPTIDFAYASVVTIAPIKRGDTFTAENIWVKRPGTGYFRAERFNEIIGRQAARNIGLNAQLSPDDILDD